VETNETRLLEPGLLGRWIIERFEIWQMPFLSANQLGSLTSERSGLLLSLGDDVRHLWQAGFLQADYDSSSAQAAYDWLELVQTDSDGESYYADSREFRAPTEGFGSVIGRLPPLPADLEPHFHPFRYYVLLGLERVLQLHIDSLQMLHAHALYPRALADSIARFQQFTGDDTFTNLVNQWNSVASLAIAVEPCVFGTLFGVERQAVGSGKVRADLLAKHREELQETFRHIGLDRIESARRALCVTADMLDPNKEVHVVLRLSEGITRLTRTQGRLGGAMYLLTMAEMLRRMAEAAFQKNLCEEDELGFGSSLPGAKAQWYGSDRILDADEATKLQYLRGLGLDYGVRVRWYVEGATEYYAIKSVLGRYRQIELLDLRGSVAEKGGKGLAFRESLRRDLSSHVFSFISIDGDRDDFRSLIAKATVDREICGMSFISQPDFEIENFTIEELVRVTVQIATDQDLDSGALQPLIAALPNAASGKQFMDAVRHRVPDLSQFGKGEDWGTALMQFALANPNFSPDSGRTGIRKIVTAIQLALKATTDDYIGTRTRQLNGTIGNTW
jgi:hypothetical protein